METKLTYASALPSQTELLRFVDCMALARASALAQDGMFRHACKVLLEDPMLLKRSPVACDLLARICFLAGEHATALEWWTKADQLSAGAEPFRSMLANARDYLQWRQSRRRAVILKLARRKARRFWASLKRHALNVTKLLRWRGKTEPLPTPPSRDSLESEKAAAAPEETAPSQPTVPEKTTEIQPRNESK